MEPNAAPTNDYCQQKLRAYERAASIAPSLSNTATRLLTELIRQASPPHWHAATSQLELTATTRCSERATRTALAQLATLSYIQVERGTQHQRSVYTLLPAITGTAEPGQTVAAFRAANFAPLGVPHHTKSRAANNAPLAVRKDTLSPATVAALTPDPQSRPATVAALGDPTYKERGRAGAFESNRIESNKLLNLDSNSKAASVTTADPAAYSAEEHAQAAELMSNYYMQLHHVSATGTYLMLPPPDQTITAQVIAASAGELRETLAAMAHKKLKARPSWAWFVPTIAELGPLQIPRATIKEAWAEQAAARRTAASATQATTYDKAADITEEAIARMAEKMRIGGRR